MSLTVEDVMVKNIITIHTKASALEAAKAMNKYGIGCLIVAEKKTPIGIVTEKDMLNRVLLKQKDPRETKINDIMTMPLIVSKPKTNIRDAVQAMNERRIKRLPVVEAGKLLGLVSLTDVVRSLAFFEHAISSLCSRCEGRGKRVHPTQT